MKCSTCDDTGSKNKDGMLDCSNCDMAEYLVKEKSIYRKFANPSHSAISAWMEAKRQSKLEIDELEEQVTKLHNMLAKYDDFILQQLGDK